MKPISQVLNADLPKPASTAIAPTAVRRDEKLLPFRVDTTAHLAPPAFNRSDRELRCVVINPNAHPTLVAALVVDPVWDRVPKFSITKVVAVDLLRRSLGMPFAPGFLKFPTNSFFLVSTDMTG